MNRRVAALRRVARLTTVAVVAAGAAGCGDGRPPLYPAGGTVAFPSGEPVRNAFIEFVPVAAKGEAGPSPRARVDASGRFALGTFGPGDGAPAGDYLVVVVQPMPLRAAEAVGLLGEEHASHGGGIPVVALRHASPATTGVSRTVEPVLTNNFSIVVEER